MKLTDDQIEVIKYFIGTYKINTPANLPPIEVDTFIGLVNERLDKNE